MPKAICGSEDRKLIFGDIEIQCYVLEDETRVLSLRSLQSGIGMSEGGGKGGARKIPALMARLATKGIDNMDLDVRANNPLRFVTPVNPEKRLTCAFSVTKKPILKITLDRIGKVAVSKFALLRLRINFTLIGTELLKYISLCPMQN